MVLQLGLYVITRVAGVRSPLQIVFFFVCAFNFCYILGQDDLRYRNGLLTGGRLVPKYNKSAQVTKRDSGVSAAAADLGSFNKRKGRISRSIPDVKKRHSLAKRNALLATG